MFPDLFWRCCCQGEFCWIQRWFQKISLAATLHDGGKLFNGADTPENQLSKSMFIHVHVHKIAASSCFCHPPSHFPYEIRVVRILYILYNILPNFLHGCCLENWSFHKSCWFVQVLVIWYFLIYDMYIPRSVYNVASKSPMWRWHPAIIIYIYIRKFQPTFLVRSGSQLSSRNPLMTRAIFTNPRGQRVFSKAVWCYFRHLISVASVVLVQFF